MEKRILTWFILFIIIGTIVIVKRIVKKKMEQKAAKRLQILKKIEEHKVHWKQTGLPLAEHPYFLLQKNENLHLYSEVTFVKPGQKTERTEKVPSIFMEIAKGLYFQIPAQRGKPIATPYVKEEQSGTLFLTNKRLVFNGISNISYLFDKIAQVECVYGALAILRGNETMPNFFRFKDEETANEFTDMLSFLLDKDIKRTLL